MTAGADALPESPALERRLVAILAADVVGYSRLMHADEEATLATLTSHRQVINDLILAGHGQIFGTAGDSVLAEFQSVVEAFHCALAIQHALWKANSELPEARRMPLRIGINVGDVMIHDGDIFGDGVNLACRVESLAEPGGVCVTRNARDQLRDRVEATFEDLGEHKVKNIARPVRVFRVAFDPTKPPQQIDLPPTRSADDGPPTAEPSEIVFWQSVQDSDDDAEYRIYLERYPAGAFADLARARLAARSAGSAEDTKVELAFWDTVRDSGNAEMIRAYLDKYPAGEFRPLAEILLAQLQQNP